MNKSPTVGLALTKCFYCNKDNQLVINTKLTKYHAKQVEELHHKVVSMEPCGECKKLMEQGIILITIDSSKSAPDWHKPPPGEHKGWMPNPYRTGGWFVVKDSFIKRVISPVGMADWAIKHRWMFIEHEAAEQLGLFAMAAKQTTPEQTK